MISTVTKTRSGGTLTVGPPPSTSEPVPVQAECPYLSADQVSLITGQRHGPTEIIQVQPYPICRFYRSDGGLQATVRIIRTENAAAAVAAVNQHVPVDVSQPAAKPAGWSGGSITKGQQVADAPNALSIYAVSKGTIAVVAEENEAPSIKARTIAICSIYALHLEPGPSPDYCSAES